MKSATGKERADGGNVIEYARLDRGFKVSAGVYCRKQLDERTRGKEADKLNVFQEAFRSWSLAIRRGESSTSANSGVVVMGYNHPASQTRCFSAGILGDSDRVAFLGPDSASRKRMPSADVKGKVADPDSPRQLHTTQLLGEVVRHTVEEMIVLFDVEGEPVEGHFRWKELKATPKDLPIGTEVFGYTQLTMVPAEPSAAAKAALEREVWAEMAGEEKEMGRVVTPEEQAAADAIWCARTAGRPEHSTPSPGDAG